MNRASHTFSFLVNQRFWLAGPLSILIALLALLSMAVWYPPGAGNINNVIMPLVLFPLVWSIVFFYTYLTDNLKRAWIVMAALFVATVATLLFQFLG